MPARRVNPTVAIASTQRAVRVPRKRIAALVARLARQEGARLAHVDVAVVTGREMAAINRRYLGCAGATDVLSFDMSDELSDGLVAQVVVCGDVAARQAPRHGHSGPRELLLYVVHGLLHLTGYDDTTPAQAARMHARAEQLLAEVYPPARRRRPVKRRR
ncbi:unnamed protein product [marine sediment metagenome]|uniref:Uncharacterized protein n=1 Tax=marine sediment metagenome TaxID=412755 RepID=X0W4K0_9ZZZZ